MEFETVELDYFGKSIKSKYPYISDSDIMAITDKAKMFYYAVKFPCEPTASEETRPITAFIDKNWVLLAAEELVERQGFSSATAYRENGMSWSLDGAHISERLISMLKPIVGVIK